MTLLYKTLCNKKCQNDTNFDMKKCQNDTFYLSRKCQNDTFIW